MPQVALLLQVSEQAAHTLLAEAQLLASLPGGLEALECGLLTVAQSAALWRAVRDLAPQVQHAVWAQLQARLVSAAQDGVVLPPARLAQLLARWVVQADPDDAQERRRRAEAQGDVSYRRREDGLGDLFATAIPAPLLQAVLCRVRAAAQPTGAEDDRTAGKRRLDALVDLLLGRQRLLFDGTGGSVSCTGAACGCRPGAPAPCGADVLVHVPIGAVLGTTDELAELVGHGPLDPEQLAAVLTSAPRVQVVRVDADGVPVSIDERSTCCPRRPRGGPASGAAAGRRAAGSGPATSPLRPRRRPTAEPRPAGPWTDRSARLRPARPRPAGLRLARLRLVRRRLVRRRLVRRRSARR